MLKPLIQIALKLLRLKLKQISYYTGSDEKYASKRDVLYAH